MNSEVAHLTVSAVKAIHGEVLAAHGGSEGIRATANLFYLCRNHSFIDGNKRTALAACLVFLSYHGLLKNEELDVDAWESLTLDVASSALNREETTARLRELCPF